MEKNHGPGSRSSIPESIKKITEGITFGSEASLVSGFCLVGLLFFSSLTIRKKIISCWTNDMLFLS